MTKELDRFINFFFVFFFNFIFLTPSFRKQKGRNTVSNSEEGASVPLALLSVMDDVQ